MDATNETQHPIDDGHVLVHTADRERDERDDRRSWAAEVHHRIVAIV